MKDKSHSQVNMTWTEYSAEDFAGLTTQQASAMADAITQLSRRLAEAEFAIGIHEETISWITGLEPIEATTRAHNGVDYIAKSRED